MAISVEPPRIRSAGLGYSYTLKSCPYTVVVKKASTGQPLQRIQRGMGLPSPWRLASSVSMPSGQNTPHHTRPSDRLKQ